ncbi:MAG: hypothetical protein KDB07_09380, partial [Planctomycetes bacterium]|nr:hypothetical protein [Planctomycetota bacterium]
AKTRDLRLRTLMAAHTIYTPSEEDFVELMKIGESVLLEVLKENNLFHEAYNQWQNVPIFLEGEPSMIGSTKHFERMTELLPNEARYLLGIANDKAILTDTARVALKLVDQVLEREPWRRGAYFTRANALLNLADHARTQEKVDTQTCQQLYNDAYLAAYQGWSRDKADINHWLELMVQALSYGRSRRNARYDPELGHPKIPNGVNHQLTLYSASYVNASLNSAPIYSSASSYVLASIFRNERATWFEKRLKTDALRVASGDFEARRDDQEGPVDWLDEELLLLGGTVQAWIALEQSPSDAIKAETLRTFLERYRSTGARLTQFERVLAASQR